MNHSSISALIKNFDIYDVERALVVHYASENRLDLAKSPFLKEYIADFTLDKKLEEQVSLIQSFSIDELAVAMELLIPEDDRIVNGTFFTPSYIVDFIIGNISPGYDETIADISCGSGAFLLGILRFYISRHHKTVRNTLADNLFGADVLDYNVRRSKVLIALFALANGETIAADEINVICCNSLTHKWQRKFDCIVGNPPYVKYQDMDDASRKYLSENWVTTSIGTYNLYFAFFEAGHKLLSADGRLGYITPNNYFTSLAGESLRDYFHRQRCVAKIVDFSSTKVFDVQTYTAITFITRIHNDSIEYGRIRDNQSPMDFLAEVEFSENRYEHLNKKKWRLLYGDEHINIHQIESAGEPIGELFNICAGIATLKDDVYSFLPIDSDDKYFYFERNNSRWKVEKELTRPTVKISDMKTQEDIGLNSRRFIFPYRTVERKTTAIPEDIMREKYPHCYSYFLSIKETLAGRGKGKHTYTPFYSYGRTQGLNRSGVKLYTPTFSKRPRFLVDFDTESLFTNGYGIYFKPCKASLTGQNPLASERNLDVIQKILNSEVMNYYITTTSIAIEGGYPCYQKNFIEKFTIPRLSTAQIIKIRSLNDEAMLNDYLEKIYQINLPSPNR